MTVTSETAPGGRSAEGSGAGATAGAARGPPLRRDVDDDVALGVRPVEALEDWTAPGVGGGGSAIDDRDAGGGMFSYAGPLHLLDGAGSGSHGLGQGDGDGDGDGDETSRWFLEDVAARRAVAGDGVTPGVVTGKRPEAASSPPPRDWLLGVEQGRGFHDDGASSGLGDPARWLQEEASGTAPTTTASVEAAGAGAAASAATSKADPLAPADPVASQPADTFEGPNGTPITPSGHNPEAQSVATASGAGNTVAEVASYLLLFLLIFGMSATVDMKNLLKQLKNKFAIGTGVAMQFVVMPFLGFVAVTALKKHGLESHMGLTLLIVSASPGGSYSNWWCSTFNADLALSVAMTALSTLLSTVLLPANLMLYANAAYGLSGENGGVLSHVDWSSLFISLAVVIAAILSGLFASYKVHSRRFRRWSNRLGTFSGIALIVFSAAFSTGTGSSEASLWGQDWSFYVGVGLPCLVGLSVANVLSRCFRLRKPEVVTLSVECCYQNVGIATSAAMAMFDDPIKRAEALCVPLFYGFVEAAVLGLYCVASWKLGWTKAPPDEKLCVVVGTTYEVADEDGINEGETIAEEGGDHDLRLEVMSQSSASVSASASASIRSARSRRRRGGGSAGGDEEDGLGSLGSPPPSARERADSSSSRSSFLPYLVPYLPARQRTRSADDRFSDNEATAAVNAATAAMAAGQQHPPPERARPRTGTEERVEAHYSARWLGTIVDFFARRRDRRRRRRRRGAEGDVEAAAGGADRDDGGKDANAKAKDDKGEDKDSSEDGNVDGHRPRGRTRTEGTDPLSEAGGSSANEPLVAASRGASAGAERWCGPIPEDGFVAAPANATNAGSGAAAAGATRSPGCGGTVATDETSVASSPASGGQHAPGQFPPPLHPPSTTSSTLTATTSSTLTATTGQGQGQGLGQGRHSRATRATSLMAGRLPSPSPSPSPSPPTSRRGTLDEGSDNGDDEGNA